MTAAEHARAERPRERTAAGKAPRGVALPARRAGRVVFGVALAWLVFLVYPLIDLTQGLQHYPASGSAHLAAHVADLVAFVGLYGWVMWRVAFSGRPHWVAVLALIGLALFLPLSYGDAAWLGSLLYVSVVLGFTLAPPGALLAAVTLAALSAAGGLWVGAPAPATLALPLVTVLAGVVTVAVNWLLRTNRDLVAARGEVERLAAGEERLRLARDLHDSVKQQVFVAAMEIGATRARLDGRSDGAAAHLQGAEGAIRAAQRDLAVVIDQLRPSSLEGKELAEALPEHVRAWSRRYGILAEARVTGARPLPPQVGDALFQVAQEALANVVRHSEASQVDLAMHSDEESVTLTLADDGRGFAADQPTLGQGLRGMRERMAAVGGTVTVDSDPGRGTRVACTAPRTR